MHKPDAAPFQGLRRTMEGEWTPGMLDSLGLQTGDLPVIWDAGFSLRADW